MPHLSTLAVENCSPESIATSTPTAIPIEHLPLHGLPLFQPHIFGSSASGLAFIMPKKRRTELAAARGLDVEALRNSLLQPNVPVLPKIAPPTEIKYEFARKCWLESAISLPSTSRRHANIDCGRYLSVLGESESAESTLQPGAKQPTPQTLKSFVQGTRGRISEYPSLRTCLLTWRNFRRMFGRCTGKGIDKDTAEDVRSVSVPLHFGYYTNY